MYLPCSPLLDARTGWLIAAFCGPLSPQEDDREVSSALALLSKGELMWQDREMIPNLDNCRTQGTCLPWAELGIFRAVVHPEINT